MVDHKDCLGYNILYERQESLTKEVVHLKEWSNEKDVEMEQQFLSLKESYDKMEQHYDNRMDKIEEKMGMIGETQVEMKSQLKTLNENFMLLLKIIGGGVLTGVIGLIFKIVWDIVVL